VVDLARRAGKPNFFRPPICPGDPWLGARGAGLRPPAAARPDGGDSSMRPLRNVTEDRYGIADSAFLAVYSERLRRGGAGRRRPAGSPARSTRRLPPLTMRGWSGGRTSTSFPKFESNQAA
jgi:hypothetical protein